MRAVLRYQYLRLDATQAPGADQLDVFDAIPCGPLRQVIEIRFLAGIVATTSSRIDGGVCLARCNSDRACLYRAPPAVIPLKTSRLRVEAVPTAPSFQGEAPGCRAGPEPWRC